MVTALALAVVLSSTSALLHQDPPTPQANSLAGLDYHTGRVVIGSDLATFDVPAGYTYLQRQDAKVVVEQFWGNPPDDTTLGLIVNGGAAELRAGGWAIVVSYDDSGYVEDDDAKDLDYGELLSDMQSDCREANPEREKLGYPSIQLLGWAEPPHYDSTAKKLYWAKRLRFGSAQSEALNYDVRILGRRGVLQLEAVGSMQDLASISEGVKKILPHVEFNPGNRYEEFDSKIDSIAAYGIGGLIAGKVLAKVGIIALLAKFAKVIIVVIIAAFAGLKRLLTGRKSVPPAAT